MDEIADFDSNDFIDLTAFHLTGGAINHANGTFVTADTADFFNAGASVVVQYDGIGKSRLYADIDRDGDFSLAKDLVVM